MGHPDGVCDERCRYGDDVYRFLLRPRWLALHAVGVVAVLACVTLGWWQFAVYDENSEREELRDRDPAPVTELAEPGAALNDGQDRRARVEGRYLADQQRLVPGRIHDGTLGSFVVTPLRDTSGMVVPVLRGWVDDPDDLPTEVPSGTIEATGFLLPPESSDQATVRSGQPLADSEVPFIAPDELAQHAGVKPDTALHGYMLLEEQDPAASAGPQQLDINAAAPINDVSPWQNLSYWAQWWVFALAAIIFWASIVRSALRSRRADVSEPVVSRVPS